MEFVGGVEGGRGAKFLKMGEKAAAQTSSEGARAFLLYVACSAAHHSCFKILFVEARERAALRQDVVVREGLGLLSTWSPSESNFLSWLRFGSWTVCSRCHTKFAQKLNPRDLVTDTAAQNQRAVCAHCSKGEPPMIVREDWPVELYGLSAEAIRTLRPLTVHQGAPVKHAHGYRRREKLTRLSWSDKAVGAKIATLTATQRERAQRAFAWLAHNSPRYAEWIGKRNAWLASSDPSSLPPSVLLAMASPLFQSAVCASPGTTGETTHPTCLRRATLCANF